MRSPVTTSPKEPVLQMTLAGLEALKRGDAVRAAQLGEEASRIAPTRADGWLLLAAALTKMGSADDERAMADALRHLAPDDPARLMIEVDRARALAVRGRANEACEIAFRIRDLPQLSPRQHDTLGSVFAMIALFEEAHHHCAIAARALPENAMVIYNLATATRYLGRIDEAEALFEKVISIDPDHSLAFASLASLKKWTDERNHVEALRAAAQRTIAGSEDAARLHFSSFKELNDLGRRDEAWAALEIGAATAHALYPPVRDAKEARTTALIEAFSVQRLRDRPAHRPSGPRPIFIYGLPRSGTTLTERILAAHSTVTAMGETSGFTLALRTTVGHPRGRDIDADMIRRSANADWVEVARRYQQNTAFLARGATCVTEKLPHNYEFVGPIHLAFPDAPLIHVRRAPMDSLFGAYRLLFGESAYVWSYTLEDIAENYRQYRRLMAHWRKALGDKITEVTLEHLIDNQDSEIRRLLAACGLAFEDACLSPHDAEGGVSTASSSQVRKPINRQGVGAWRAYAAQLEPLRAALERDGFVDADGEPIWN